MASLFLGIDTGGTFTDGVLLDTSTHMVVKKTKALTTHHDLRICISQVLDQLVPPGPLAQSVRLVSLSTTLATNAIVEGKSRPAALLLLGYDPELVYRYDFHRQFGSGPFFFIQGGMDLRGHEQAPLDEAALRKAVEGVRDQVEAFAVSSYGGTMNAGHEKRAEAIIEKMTGLPVVQGHHLTSRLNSIRRATTASLNASLLSTAFDFLHTVQSRLAERGIHCPLVIVRGDGSLVSAEFAAHRPVEIIHSGPATSAIGGLYLSGEESALVVDIGGTTTDLALLQHGRTILDGRTASVGGYHTSVRTIRARSFGLGGDSQIRFSPRGEVTVGPERVIPLSFLAHTYPEASRELHDWLASAPEKFSSDKLEFWLPRRTPRQPFTDPRTNTVLRLLADGPRRMAWLLKQAGAVSAVQVDGKRLVQEDIIQRAGLTPTDLLHVTGEYAPWDATAAKRVVETIARMWDTSVEDVIQRVRDVMTRKISAEIVQFISGQPVPEDLDPNDSLGRWVFEQSLSPSDPFLSARVQLSVPLIGIGAPAKAFLDPVAKALCARVIYPEHFEVANAVGTVVGNVLVHKEAEIVPLVEGTVITGYLARAGSTQRQFDTLEEALVYAREAVTAQAADEAREAGAEDPRVHLSEKALLGGMVQLMAQAVGKPGVGR